jgi:hypothetical protein
MTKPIKYDFFSFELRNINSRFFAVLTEEVVLETSNENFDKVYKRGIYTFQTVRERNIFTSVCNDAKDKTVAFRYNRERN